MADKMNIKEQNLNPVPEPTSPAGTKLTRRGVIGTATTALGAAALGITVLPKEAQAETASSPVQAPEKQVNLPNFEIDGGWFYTETRGETAEYPHGYGIVNDAEAPMYDIFQWHGGVDRVGPPVSRRWKKGSWIHQATQKTVFQVRENGVYYVNVYDELAKQGVSLDNATDLVPDSFDWSSDGTVWGHTKEGPLPGTIEENHFNKVFEGEIAQQIEKQVPGSIQALKSKYLENQGWFEQYGLPMSVKYYPDQKVVVVRGQRAAFQYWINKMTWTKKPGEVSIVNGGDDAKKYGLIPEEARQPELPPPVGGGGGEFFSNFPETLGNWQTDKWELHNNGKIYGITVRDPQRLTEIFHESTEYHPLAIRTYDPPNESLPRKTIEAKLPDGRIIQKEMYYITNSRGEDVLLGKVGFPNDDSTPDYLKSVLAFYIAYHNLPTWPDYNPNNPPELYIIPVENFSAFDNDKTARNLIDRTLTRYLSGFLGGMDADLKRRDNPPFTGLFASPTSMLKVEKNIQ